MARMPPISLRENHSLPAQGSMSSAGRKRADSSRLIILLIQRMDQIILTLTSAGETSDIVTRWTSKQANDLKGSEKKQLTHCHCTAPSAFARLHLASTLHSGMELKMCGCMDVKYMLQPGVIIDQIDIIWNGQSPKLNNRRHPWGPNPAGPQTTARSCRTRVGTRAFLADAVGFVWEMTEQTGPEWLPLAGTSALSTLIHSKEPQSNTQRHTVTRNNTAQSGGTWNESHWPNQGDRRQFAHQIWAQKTVWLNCRTGLWWRSNFLGPHFQRGTSYNDSALLNVFSWLGL